MPSPRIIAGAVAAALALPATASAHVTLQPDTATAGGFTRLDVRVPNEREDSATTRVDVQFPEGFEFASYEPRAGWKVTVRRSGERVTRMIWSGGRIEPGQFVDFGLSLRMPEGAPGDRLTFKALQTYDDGEVVRWIGPEDAEEPAPIVTLTAEGGGVAGSTGGDTATSSDDAAGAQEPATTGENASAPAETSSDDGGSDGLAIAALVVAILALGAALLAALRPRPRARA
jgi:periplasmic copper chaperone A